MTGWPFVIAAYCVTILGTSGLLLRSWLGMRSAEREAESLKQPRS